MVTKYEFFIMKVTKMKRGGRKDERISCNSFNGSFWICCI
ncbi:hypothetical protein bcere0022_36140 [Bacillus cereus Rock3-44]|nr:hypothetical protein bcere0022_36140 [Bacillus cereus Rock3-44]